MRYISVAATFGFAIAEPLFLSAPYLLQMSFENGLRTRFSIH